eukprot:4908622-Alexandrium_andersonii.AAC.1
MCPGAALEAAGGRARATRRAPAAGSAAVAMDDRDLRMRWGQATAGSARGALRAVFADYRSIRGEAGGLSAVV